MSPAILKTAVTNISTAGFWMRVENTKYFIPFTEYPAFKQATIAQIYNMVILSPTQYHWPQL
jgi:hypothetical protein